MTSLHTPTPVENIELSTASAVDFVAVPLGNTQCDALEGAVVPPKHFRTRVFQSQFEWKQING